MGSNQTCLAPNRLTTANLLPSQRPQSLGGTLLVQAMLIFKSQDSQVIDAEMFESVRCLAEFFPAET